VELGVVGSFNGAVGDLHELGLEKVIDGRFRVKCSFDPLFLRGHLGVEFEELFQPLGVVLEAAADVDALQRLVVALVSGAQVGKNRVLSLPQLMPIPTHGIISDILPIIFTLAVVENFFRLASDPIVFRWAQILAIPFEVSGKQRDFPHFIDHQWLVDHPVATALSGVERGHMHPHLPQPARVPDQRAIFRVCGEDFHHIGAAFAQPVFGFLHALCSPFGAMELKIHGRFTGLPHPPRSHNT
jgi:hypothetical protein